MKGTGLSNWLASAAMALALAVASPALATDGVLDRGIGSEWSSLDPHVNFDAAAGWIQSDAYEGLVNFDGEGKVIPGAAESWEVSEDGKTYTFRLREGLKWSNGDPLVAQQFVDGILRTLNPETASEKGYYFYSVIQIKGAEALANGETTDPATLGVTAPDDRTVVVEMETPAPHILDIMGSFQVAPLHGPSYAEAGSAVFIDPAKVVGNGAYVIKEVVPQSHVLLEANPNYWDAANVSIKQVKYHVTEDVVTELKRFQAGEIDITYDIPVNQIDQLKADMPDEVIIGPSTEVTYYTFNLTKPELQNIDVRRALSLAIDRELLQEKIVKGGAIPSYSYAGGFDPTYQGPTIPEASMTQADRNAKAQELMAAAGFGPDNPLKLNIVTTVAEDRIRLAQGISLMWKQTLGVEASVESLERKAWLDSFYAGTWDVFADNLVGDFAGAETFLAYMRPSADAGYNWDKPEFDAQMDVAASKADRAERNVELAKAEQILLDDVLFAPIAIEPFRRLVSKKVKGYAVSVAGYNNSQFLSLE
ncbi:peptide ABC transporter substrate-binding protein [Aliigemmobacter aestuarii]|uniref:Peptide ABC transporter substrate-binding protein n=1 Tax=Aliigemmobacter aestuarii TaxID=1445661 RepID=A0A4S3MUK5_9RHOB|nr:peptide ABC transporter substrate-binding protein [Gemmobacter aestuarii]THD85615.1 peptide ABC transporter substrate-binding protein [Gemmobacter aestuarii]